MEDTKFQCTRCGQIGSVGRCCGLDTRIPLNDAARGDVEAIIIINLPSENQARKILYQYYNLLMDDYNGNASEEAIDDLLEEVRRKTALSLSLNYCDTGEIDTYEKAVTALEALVQWEETKSICKSGDKKL